MGRIFSVIAALAGLVAVTASGSSTAQTWSKEEINTLRSLWIGSLSKLPKDPSNTYGDDQKAAKFGHMLFFDSRFSDNGKVSCASCHQPDRDFTDGLTLAKAMGTTSRHTPTIIGMAYSPWFFWDGRKDSQWSQALGPMESPVEHGGTRAQFAKIIFSDPAYRKAYEQIFSTMPDVSDAEKFPANAAPIDASGFRMAWNRMKPADRKTVSGIYANIGKAIAAYERLILPGPSRFDGFVEAILKGDEKAQRRTLTDEEISGLRIYIGKGNCTQCHNGPLFTNNEFHNTGLPVPKGGPGDEGRAKGVREALEDEFNCLGPFSDAGAGDCGELKFAKTEGAELMGSFKTPTLRNISKTAPYMHDGQLPTLGAVLDHYNRAPAAMSGQSELKPLQLEARELDQLRRFLLTLDSPPSVSVEFLSPPR